MLKNEKLFFNAYRSWHWGEGFQTLLVTWYVTFHIALPPEEIGFYQAAVLCPFLGLSLFGGVLSDRLGPIRIYTLSAGGLVVLFAGYGIYTLYAEFNPILFFVYCLASGTLSAFASPAIDRFIPNATPLSAQQNSILALKSHYIAKFVGTLSALTFPVLQVAGGFLLNAAGFLLSIVQFRKFAQTNSVQRPDVPYSTRLEFSEMKEFARKTQIQDIIFTSVIQGLFVISTRYILVPLVIRARFPEYGDWIAIVWVMVWIGAISTTTLVQRYSSLVKSYGSIAILAWFCHAIALFLMLFTHNFGLFLGCVFIFGAEAVGKAILYGGYLKACAEKNRAFAASIDQTAYWGSATIGTIAVGYLVAQLGLEMAIVIQAVAMILSLLVLVVRGNIARIV